MTLKAVHFELGVYKMREARRNARSVAMLIEMKKVDFRSKQHSNLYIKLFLICSVSLFIAPQQLISDKLILEVYFKSKIRVNFILVNIRSKKYLICCSSLSLKSFKSK